ncbi:Molybdopterin-guanine dinucleotide biosynthesis protein MobA [hydrothermal vent metagenome]|uniref:Molybdopterin-guanine dinucleotide biosynthesis protein MobA n=1 Tax=hydrothermal vent metagenome TaxID=652676 RepID=A0A1W1EJU3_9ZZZZ
MLDNSIAFIFAGGRSSRMGTDKSLLKFGDKNSMAQFQYDRLKKIFSKVYISAKENKFDFNPSIILDKYPQHSPLVAIISIFETLDIEEAFILSVDAPFIDIDIIKKLYDNNDKSKDAIVASTSSGIQPLCAIYKKSIILKAKEYLEKDIHKLKYLLKNSNSTFIEFDDESKFTNLNYREEYINAMLKSI